MKKYLITGFAFSCLAFTTIAQTTEEIVKKHIEAIGGKENWDKLKSMRSEGTVKAQGAEIKITNTQIDKKASRTDIALMGMVGYNILTTTEGWNFLPFQGQTKPEPITADDLKSGQEQLDIKDEFLTYKEKGKKLEDLGKDDVDGTECFKLKLTDKIGTETTFYIDPSNFYIIKQTVKMTANGKEMENSSTFSNYKKTDGGIVVAMSIGGGFGDMEITKVEVNPTIDESIFKLPK
jgi:hypothetical protein